MKNRRELLRAFEQTLRRGSCAVSRDESVLVLGAGDFDLAALTELGFHNLTASYFSPRSSSALSIDAEDIALPENSFDALFAHEVLHHLRCPHKALCEMLRVARRHVVFMEPNDSAAMRILVAAGLSFPFELLSVQAHRFEGGGVRDTNIPNYIYRWTRREVKKTVSSYLPATAALVHASGYWDFNVGDLDLSLRESSTRLGGVCAVFGERNFLALLGAAQKVLNALPGIRQQGNKFFCVIEKQAVLRPWLKTTERGVEFDRAFSVHGTVRRGADEDGSARVH